MVEEAAARCNPWDLDEGPPEVFNELCKIASKGLRAQTEARLQGAGRDLRRRRTGLVPGTVAIVRAALPMLQEWVSKMSEERASAARLAYKDACGSARTPGRCCSRCWPPTCRTTGGSCA
jgi:hypothetical protein